MERALFILIGILGISLLVIVHELGHYLTARWLGMKVERFSIGIGPTLFKYRPKGSPTTYQVCAIPFLAYVQIAGMNPFEESDRNDPTLFPNKSVFARIVVILGGPAFNYLLASVIVFGMVLTAPDGYPYEVVEPVTVGLVAEDSAAQAAGLQLDDVFVSGDGTAIDTFDDLIRVTAPRAGQATEYLVRRGGREISLTITPRDNEGTGLIGVGPKRVPMYGNTFGEALEAAVIVPWVLTQRQLVELAKRFGSCSLDGLSGPKKMAETAADAAESGLRDYLHILWLISVALGLFNLLPFPALDGGRFMFLAYEVITRQRPNERLEAVVHTVGILILLSLIAFVTYGEIVN